MKLLILGATGKVGRLIVARALEQGHEVTAFVRDPAKLDIKHAHLTLYVADATAPGQIKAAMAGQDAVLSALGHNSAKHSAVLTTATRAVLGSLAGHQRFISLTGDGAYRDPNDPPAKLGGRLVNLIVKLLPGGTFADGAAHAILLVKSRANWVLVRSPRMTGGPATHHYKAGYFAIGFGTHATRGDIADFMLTCLSEYTWLRKAPIIVSQ